MTSHSPPDICKITPRPRKSSVIMSKKEKEIHFVAYRDFDID